jgi:hypothetical protein
MHPGRQKYRKKRAPPAELTGYASENPGNSAPGKHIQNHPQTIKEKNLV